MPGDDHDDLFVEFHRGELRLRRRKDIENGPRPLWLCAPWPTDMDDYAAFTGRRPDRGECEACRRAIMFDSKSGPANGVKLCFECLDHFINKGRES